MQNAFEEIREEIHSIRNLLSPIDLKLDNLDHKIGVSRIAFESKTADLEAKIGANTLKISEHAFAISKNADEIAQQLERIKQIEQFLKLPQSIPQSAGKLAPAPAHEDKAAPSIQPPKTPPAA